MTDVSPYDYSPNGSNDGNAVKDPDTNLFKVSESDLNIV